TALDEIASMEGFLPFDEPIARGVINKFLRFPNIFATVHLYRADGSLVFAKRRATMGSYIYKTNFYEKDPDFIAQARRVLAEKHPRASEVIFSSKGTLYQTYITPVFSDDKKEHVFGILSGGVFPRLQRIDHLLYGLKLGKENFILITDSHGHFITSDGISESHASTIKRHTGQAAKLFFTSDKPDLSNAFVENKLEVDDNSYIVISLPIDELKLLVTLGVNTHRIESNSRDLSYRLLVALVIGSLLSLVASIFIGDRLAKPFREIAEAINRINKGDLGVKVDYMGEDEIGYLAEAVNVLSEKIRKSEYLGSLWSIDESSDSQVLGQAEINPSSSDTIGELDSSDCEQKSNGDDVKNRGTDTSHS
ncbi:MAG: HAMP domain-containing protein, partial [Candidatus Obscuribacterales bacterium]|nr:HAMP domain-containing protein [Candidatus Obscuribacterales bacterium]